MNQLKVGAILNYVSIALNMLIGLVYTPYLLRSLGQSEYGLYSLATSLIAYLTVLDLGFGNAIVRYTAKYRAEGNIIKQEYMFGMFLILYCVIGIIVFIIGSFLACNTDFLFSKSMTNLEISRTQIMIWLMTINLAFTFPMSIWGSIMTAYERFIFQRVVSIVRSILNPLTMLVLLAFGYKAVALVVVTTLYNFVTLGINYIYCKRKLSLHIRFGRINKSLLKEVAIFSFWVFLTAIADKIYWSSGQILLGIFCGSSIVAVFAVAIQLKEMYYLFSSAICGVFLPSITAMVSKGVSIKQISDLFIRTGRIQYAVMAFILTAYIIFGRQFVNIWAGADYDESYYIALLFLISTTIPLIQNLSISILMAMNRLKKRSLIIVIASISGLLISMPAFKYGGAMAGTVVISVTIIITYGFLLNAFYLKDIGLDIKRFWKEIFKMSLTPFIFIICGYLIKSHLYIKDYVSFFGYVMFFVCLYVPMFFKLSMNDYERSLLVNPVKRIFKRYRK